MSLFYTLNIATRLVPRLTNKDYPYTCTQKYMYTITLYWVATFVVTTYGKLNPIYW